MDYRAPGAGGPTTFESVPGGLAVIGCMGTLFVPLWLLPGAIAYHFLDGGSFEPVFLIILPLCAAGWAGLFLWASAGERLILDAEGVRWEAYRALGPVRTPTRVRRAAPWALVSAKLVRQLRTSKSGAPYEEVTLKLTFPDGTHDVSHDAFKPWANLLRELESRLGDRYQVVHDHGALGAAVQRMVDQRLAGETKRSDVRVE